MLITMGTGHLTSEEEAEFDLTSKHDYTVLQLKEESGGLVALIKNPWRINDGPNKLSRYTRALQRKKHAVEELDSELSTLSLGKSGLFWIDVEDIPQYFEYLYINWNPELFGYRRDVHFVWKIEDAPLSSCRAHPQYSLMSHENGGTVWLLLQRHFQTGSEVPGGAQGEPKRPGASGIERSSSAFIGLYVFDGDGTRVLTSDGAFERTPYVDTPQALLQLQMPARATYTVVVSHERLIANMDYSFTLSAFSSQPMDLEPAKDRYDYSRPYEAAWNGTSLGGNDASFATQYEDPQFSLSVEQRSDIALVLETLHEDIPIRVALVWCDGDCGEEASQSTCRTTSAMTTTSRDMVGDSGDYRRGGCAVAEFRELRKGLYTIICSTFEDTRQHGRCKFTLHVGSTSNSCAVRRLPSETAGRRSITLSGGFPSGSSRLAAPLWCSRMTRLRLVARYKQSRESAQQPYRPHTESRPAASLSARGSSARSKVRLPLRISLRSDSPRPFDPSNDGQDDVLAISNEGHFTSVSAYDTLGSTLLRTADVDIVPDVHHQRHFVDQVQRAHRPPNLSGSSHSAQNNLGPLPLWIVVERQPSASQSVDWGTTSDGRQENDDNGQVEQREEGVVQVEILSDHHVDVGSFHPH